MAVLQTRVDVLDDVLRTGPITQEQERQPDKRQVVGAKQFRDIVRGGVCPKPAIGFGFGFGFGQGFLERHANKIGEPPKGCFRSRPESRRNSACR
ncbi:hypothetical protein GCM10029978_100400 [Actinoallomurus acanthiterrae]